MSKNWPMGTSEGLGIKPGGFFSRRLAETGATPEDGDYIWMTDAGAGHIFANESVASRDYSGIRGPVPGTYRAHDWQTCRVLRQLADGYAAKRALREAKKRFARHGWRVSVKVDGRLV